MNKNTVHWVLTVATLVGVIYTILATEFGMSIFRGPQLSFEISNSIMIWEDMGRFTLQPTIQIKNTGGKPGIIKKLSAYLKHTDTEGKTTYNKILDGERYRSVTSSTNGDVLLIGPFHVAPKEVWGAQVWFYEQLTQQQEDARSEYAVEAFRDLLKQYETDVKEYHKNKDHKGPKQVYYIKDEEKILSPLKAVVDTQTKMLTSGDYELLIMAWKENDDTPSIKKAYTFSLTKKAIDTLTIYTTELLKSRPGFHAKEPMFYGNQRIEEIVDKNRIKALYNSFVEMERRTQRKQ